MTNAAARSFEQLDVGDVIIDQQGARHVVTEIGDWEMFHDVWNGAGLVSRRGRRIFTDTYPDGRSYTVNDMQSCVFQVVR